VLSWEEVGEFTVGSVELPATPKRKKIGWGPKAIRVPQGGKFDRVLAACAYVGPERSLYLDAELTQLLCSVVPSGDNSWSVHDGGGSIVGTITRIPSNRPLLRPNWRIEQPGQVDVIGRTEWLSGDAKQLAEKAAGRLFSGVLDALTSFGAEGGDQPTKQRVLEWRAGDDIVMLSEATKSIRIKAAWLDRRLAFAYSLIAE
jgi:hypothetical protein